MSATVLVGDCLEVLPTLASESVHCCVTSPPYWGLRDYGVEGQLGLEPDPGTYVERLVAVFREVRRVLRDDGTLWLNLGDSYSGSGPSGASYQSETTKRRAGQVSDGSFRISKTLGERGLSYKDKKPIPAPGLKPKDLVGIPWRVAFALQQDGWYLRQDIIWHKPNPMPESVRDRCTKAHEYVFLLSKGPRYYFDAGAIKEPALQPRGEPRLTSQHKQRAIGQNQTGTLGTNHGPETRNRRSVWTIATRPYKGAHFAVFPPKLIEPCILAGCPEGGTVLDPFAGSGTTLQVATKLGREAIGVELNPKYAELIRERLESVRSDDHLFAGAV